MEFAFELADRWRKRQCTPRIDGRRKGWARPAVAAISLSTLMLFADAGMSQETVRVRGTIERVDGSSYIVKTRDGNLVTLSLAADAKVASSVKSSISDIRLGTYIGIAAVPQTDGSLRALEAHIFDESMRGTAEGHRSWDLLPKSTMTNAVVQEIVAGVDSRAVTLRYKGGEQRILIFPATPVVTYLPGSIGELIPGAVIFVPGATRQPNGALIAQRVMVGRNAPPPQ